MGEWLGSWEGGRVWQDDDGRRTYVIRRRVNGRRYEVSTRASTLKAALEHLKRFEADPASYDPSGGPKPVHKGGVTITDELIETHIKAADVTHEWGQRKRVLLRWWATKLTRDLRVVTRLELTEALRGHTMRRDRLRVLSAYYGWLNEEGYVEGYNPVMGMKIEKAKPAQWTKRRSISKDTFERTFACVAESQYRDVLTILSNTGLHVREVRRIAVGHAKITATAVTVIHKSGRPLALEVEGFVAEAAQRIFGNGLSISRLMKSIKKAAKAAGVESWAPGALRHSWSEWQIEAGVEKAQVAARLGHASSATTSKFYSTLAVIPLPKGAVSVRPTTLRVVE